MCRIIYAPPYSNKNDILDIAQDMLGSNTEGFGYGYWEGNKPVIHKWGKSLNTLLRNKNNKILEHMRGNRFDKPTLIHMRLASCGPVNKANAHPFLIGKNNIFCHNGTYNDAPLIKLAMGKDIKYTSETDSEIAGNLINRIGMKRFVKEVNFGGVFMMLNKSNYLTVGVTSGDLSFSDLGGGVTLIASELDDDEFENSVEAEQGWYIFNPQGKLVQKKEKYPVSKVTVIDYSKTHPYYSKVRPENRSAYLQALHYDGGWREYD